LDKVRIGIVGVGGMGSAHASNVSQMETATLAAVCDIDPSTLKATSEKYGVPGFANHLDLLSSGLVDAVMIATPHYFHPPIAVDAFARGLHVLSEKPIAVTVAAADGMIAAAKASGLKFAVMYQMRTEPVYMAAKRLIDEGRLGEIYRTCLIMGWYRSQAYYDSGGWRATWTGEGGGVLINQAPHLLDIFSWLVGMPESIHGQVWTQIHDIEVEDEAFAFLAYPNGAHGYLYTSTTEVPGADILEIAGEKGKLRVQNGKLSFFELAMPRKQFTVECESMWASPEASELPVDLTESATGHGAITANWVDAIVNDAPLISPGEQGLNAVELINGMIMSGHTNAPVKLPVDRAAYDELLDGLRASSKGKTGLREQRVTDPQHA